MVKLVSNYFLIICIILSLNYAYSQVSTLKGIDVSHHQGIIEWDSIISGNISFAFVKATEGYTFKDSLFSRNWEEMKRVGIKRGAYHFFRGNTDPKKQAINYIETVALDSGDVVPILDIEKLDGVSSAKLIKNAKIWLIEVEKAYKVKPIIYAGQYFYNKYLANSFKGYPLWIAEFTKGKPVLVDGRKYHIWQYSEKGIVKGIKGRTDLNKFYGDYEGLNSLCKK